MHQISGKSLTCRRYHFANTQNSNNIGIPISSVKVPGARNASTDTEILTLQVLLFFINSFCFSNYIHHQHERKYFSYFEVVFSRAHSK